MKSKEAREAAKQLTEGQVWEKVVYCLVGAGRVNLLSSVPHRKWLDMRLVYGLYIDEEHFAYITNATMKKIGVSEQELYAAARENTPRILPASIRTMEEITGIAHEEQVPMIVITNEKAAYGAAAILYDGVMEAVAEKLQDDLLLIPSSIHEIIALPARFGHAKKLDATIGQVNAENVKQSEQLGTHHYCYLRELKGILLGK